MDYKIFTWSSSVFCCNLLSSVPILSNTNDTMYSVRQNGRQNIYRKWLRLVFESSFFIPHPVKIKCHSTVDLSSAGIFFLQAPSCQRQMILFKQCLTKWNTKYLPEVALSPAAIFFLQSPSCQIQMTLYFVQCKTEWNTKYLPQVAPSCAWVFILHATSCKK